MRRSVFPSIGLFLGHSKNAVRAALIAAILGVAGLGFAGGGHHGRGHHGHRGFGGHRLFYGGYETQSGTERLAPPRGV